MLAKPQTIVGATTLPHTAEHVSGGHPDKACDQMADSIIDAMLDEARDLAGDDPAHADHPSRQRAAIEMLVKDHLLVISGEVRTSAGVAARMDIPGIVRRKWADIGYPDPDRLTVINHLQVQSAELQASSDRNGAGDQGIMVGYATNETPSFLPPEYELARDLCMRIQELRTLGIAPWIRSDSKTQVTLDAGARVDRVVIAVQHAEEVDGVSSPRAASDRIKAVLMEHAVAPVLGQDVPASRVTVNGSGSFVVGGPLADAGVVGRKIVVDAYGPRVPVGGGAYSGKDPTKVDRSAAYMARHIAKTAAHLHVCNAKAVTVHIAFCIGMEQPEMVTAVTETGANISAWVASRFPDLRPAAIAERLDLWRTSARNWRYQDTAVHGHYGRPAFPWEGVADVSD